MKGMFLLLGTTLASLVIGWQIQQLNLMLGFAATIAMLFISTIFSVDYIARNMK
jgi:hypothetical protein